MIFQKKQLGAATLVIAIVLLFASTLLVIFSAKVGVQDQKISGNDYRARVALSAAEDGLEQTKAYIKSNTEFFTYGDADVTCAAAGNPATLCSATVSGVKSYTLAADTLVAPLNSSSFQVTIQQLNTGVLTVASIGTSVDGTGSATVQEQYISSGVVSDGPVPPVMAVGIVAGGNFTAVGNPKIKPCKYVDSDGDGDYSCVAVTCPAGDESDCDQLLSTWSATAPSLSGSLQTCLPEGFRDGTSSIAAQCIGPGIADDSGLVPTWNQCACRTGADADAYSTDTEMNEDLHVSPVPLDPDPFDDVFNGCFL